MKRSGTDGAGAGAGAHEVHKWVWRTQYTQRAVGPVCALPGDPAFYGNVPGQTATRLMSFGRSFNPPPRPGSYRRILRKVIFELYFTQNLRSQTPPPFPPSACSKACLGAMIALTGSAPPHFEPVAPMWYALYHVS